MLQSPKSGSSRSVSHNHSSIPRSRSPHNRPTLPTLQRPRPLPANSKPPSTKDATTACRPSRNGRPPHTEDREEEQASSHSSSTPPQATSAAVMCTPTSPDARSDQSATHETSFQTSSAQSEPVVPINARRSSITADRQLSVLDTASIPTTAPMTSNGAQDADLSQASSTRDLHRC